MKAIWKQNFMSYFNSPMGYAFIFIFITIMNLLFYLFNVLGSSSDVTGLFSTMLFLLIVLIPFLTMRLFSEEYKLRTDQLLLTVPTDLWEIVLGKFLAVLSVIVVSLAFTLMWVVVIYIYGVVETGVILGNYVAIICISAAFISVGMLISSLTENQIIASIGTLGLLLALFVVNTITMKSAITGLTSIVSWFSLFRRYQGFILGVFSIADIFYYISFTGTVLFLTTRILERKRWN
jgi:ABC-2 type transport system permease protein